MNSRLGAGLRLLVIHFVTLRIPKNLSGIAPMACEGQQRAACGSPSHPRTCVLPRITSPTPMPCTGRRARSADQPWVRGTGCFSISRLSGLE